MTEVFKLYINNAWREENNIQQIVECLYELGYVLSAKNTKTEEDKHYQNYSMN